MCGKTDKCTLEDLSVSKLKGQGKAKFFDPPLILDDGPTDPNVAAYHSEKVDFYMNKDVYPRLNLDEVPHPKRDE